MILFCILNIGTVLSWFIASVHREEFGWSCLGRSWSTRPTHCRPYGDGHFFYWLVLLWKTKYSVAPLLTAASLQCLLFSTATFYNGLSTRNHFFTVATSLQWPALYNSHLSMTATLICFSLRMVSLQVCIFTLVVASLQWPPLQTGNSH